MNGFWQTAIRVFQSIILSAETYIELLLMASSSAMVLAVVVALVNLAFRRWLSSRQLSLMWGIVLMRLLMPFAPPTTWSLSNLLPADEIAQPQVIQPPEESLRFFGSADNVEVDFPKSLAATTLAAEPEFVPVNTTIDHSFAYVDRFACLIFWSFMAIGVDRTFQHVDLLLCLVFWGILSIGLLQFARSIIVHFRFCHRLQAVPDCWEPRVTALWIECCRQARVGRLIPVKFTDEIVQPAIVGAIRPCLIVPQSILKLNDKQLRMVMFHELEHVRAWDVTTNWIVLGIRILYWWNPLYWIAAGRMERLREQACDAYAIRMIEGHSVRDYGELLLMLAQQHEIKSFWQVRLPATLLGFFKGFFRKRMIENRLRALRFAERNPTSRRQLIGIATLGVLAICGLTDASIKAPKISQQAFPEFDFDRNPDWYALRSGWCLDRNGNPREGATVVRRYNIVDALKRFSEFAGSLENGQRELQHMLLHRIQGSTGRYHTLPQDWARARVIFEDGTATIDAPNVVQEQLAWEIATWARNAYDPQICMRLTFVGDDANLDAIEGLSWCRLDACSLTADGALISETVSGSPMIRTKSPPDSDHPIRVAKLNETQVEQLRNQPVLRPGPAITGFNGQRCTLFAGHHRPFVTGISLGDDDSRKPKVELIDDGFHFSCRSTEFNDPGHLKMEVTLEMSRIVDVTTASTLIHDEPAMIQVPRVKLWHMDLDADLQNDESLLIGCIPQFADGSSFYVLLTKNKFREASIVEHAK